MKKVALTGLITLFGLSSCGSLSGGTTAATLTAQATTISKLSFLATGKVMCPPDARHPTWWECGMYSLSVVGPRPGGDIIPADLIIQGSKSAYEWLGDSAQATLPESGYSKFRVGRLIFTVAELDRGLLNAAFTAKFTGAEQLHDGSYQFKYSGELALRK